MPFPLVYVAGKAPSRIQGYLQQQSIERGFSLITTQHHISPNQARNLGLKEVKTRYVVFIDNDALVTPGWLDALVRCAEETSAAVVGPLCLIGEIGAGVVHVAGGIAHIKEESGKRVFYDEQYLFNTPIRAVNVPLTRKAWDYVEFHCMLVRTEMFQSLGGLDEQLMSVHEHIDFCLSVKRAGGSVYVEPKSVVSYIPSPPYDWTDLPYFMLRWSEDWNITSTNRFCEKWGVEAMGWLGNQSTPASNDLLIKFGRGHRRIMTGVGYVAGPETEVSPLEQAELMIALFQSIDRNYFDLRLSARNGELSESCASVGADEAQRRLPELLRQAECQGLGVAIRPLDEGRRSGLRVLRLDNLGPLARQHVQQSAFMTLETDLNSYQCWFALDHRQLEKIPNFASRIVSDPLAVTPAPFIPLAGSRPAPTLESARVSIVSGCAGRLMAANLLSDRSTQLLFEACIIQ